MDLLTSAAVALTVADGDEAAPPGAVVAVWDGVSTGAGRAGVRDLDSGDEMTPSTLHDIASVSKVLTTVALLRLVDQGGLNLGATLGQLLGRGAGLHEDRTLTELLLHRAGLWEWWPLYADPRSSDDPLRAVASLPCRYQPGHARHYSDLGFQLLGAVIAAVHGRPYAEAIEDLVIAPLGMTDTSPGPRAHGAAAAGGDGDAIERAMLATGVPYPTGVDPSGFVRWREHVLRGEISDGNAFHAFQGAAGHAGWFSTARDLLALASALAGDPDQHRLWRRSTLMQFLRAPHDAGQALGFRRYSAGKLVPGRVLWGHPGFTGCAVAFAPAGPGPALAVVVTTNRTHGRPAPTAARLPSVERLLATAMRVLRSDPTTPLEVAL